jgi:iduronate 2-sulfatase
MSQPFCQMRYAQYVRLQAFVLLLFWLGTETCCAIPPNVLFIAVDDLRPELGCYGNTTVVTPNIDRLAADGTVFRRAYCQQALCGPSRVSLLTGKYPDQLKIWGMSAANPIEWRTERPGVTSLPEQFRKHGYKTIGFGKIFDDRLGLDRAVSWDSFTPGGRPTYADPENARIGKGKSPTRPAFEQIDAPDNEYSDGSNTDSAIRTIKEHDSTQPLFLAVGFIRPHLPFVAPKKYWDLYNPDRFEVSRRVVPPEGHSEYLLSNYQEIFTYDVPNPIPDAIQRKLIHAYFACISYVDAQIGRIVDALKQQGGYENTIIVLWGDHGFKLGEYGQWAKATNLELDARVPLILKLTKNQCPAGKSTMSLVQLVDVMPTLCEAAGLPIPESVDGMSLMPVLKNPLETIRDFALTQYPRHNKTMAYSIRTDMYRYHEVLQKPTGDTIATELYRVDDLSQEPVNLTDRNSDIAHQHSLLLKTHLQRMSGKMRKGR